jgi:predicted metal-dependent phosphoesterase TrpH
VAKLTEVQYAAASIAASKTEELSAIDAVDLDASYNEDEVVVTWPGLDIEFHRSVQVTVNPDESRTILVTVESAHDGLPARSSFRTTFAVWE